MQIKVGTDGSGMTLEIRREPHETDQDEVRQISRLIAFLAGALQKKP